MIASQSVKNQKTKKIYLDVCTLCRPLDDQDVMRIRLETDAFYLILQAIQNNVYEMVFSPVYIEEINAIEDLQEQYELLALLRRFGKKAKGDLTQIRSRADFLHAEKFGVADAAHIAFAEATADFFISCDDRLLKKCTRGNIAIEALSPLQFIIKEDLK